MIGDIFLILDLDHHNLMLMAVEIQDAIQNTTTVRLNLCFVSTFSIIFKISRYVPLNELTESY